MSSKTKVITAGALAAIFAIATIAGLMYLGVLMPVSNQNQGTGQLAVMITDPPRVPEGVTAVYITYSNLEVHVADAGNNSGWKLVKASGTIELMGTVNISQTIASVNIQSGKYNLLRFNISSAEVTYNGKNYTAFVPSSMLTVPIIGGIQVNNSKLSATIIDISPMVINIGSQSNPEFIIRAEAKAFPVPSSETTAQLAKEGFRMSLSGKAWWKQLNEKFTENLQVTNAVLSSNSLSLTVKNTGNESTTLRLVIISPLSLVSPLADHGKDKFGRLMPPTILFSAVFVVESNGTLVPLQKIFDSNSVPQMLIRALSNTGYELKPGGTATLSYSGSILTCVRTVIGQSSNLCSPIVSGQQYLITVIGDEALAGYVVVAS